MQDTQDSRAVAHSTKKRLRKLDLFLKEEAKGILRSNG